MSRLLVIAPSPLQADATQIVEAAITHVEGYCGKWRRIDHAVARGSLVAMARESGADHVLLLGAQLAGVLPKPPDVHIDNVHMQGILRESRSGQRWIATPHPQNYSVTVEEGGKRKSAVTAANLIGHLVRHLELLRWGHVGWDDPAQPVRTRMVRDRESLREFQRTIERAATVAIDTETRDLRRIRNQLLMVQMGVDGHVGWVLPVGHGQSPLDPRLLGVARDWLREYLESGDACTHVYANGSFDLHQLTDWCDLRWYEHRVWDVQYGEFSLDENRESRKGFGFTAEGDLWGLERICQEHGMFHYATSPVRKDERSRMASIPLSRMAPYGALDAALPLRVMHMQREIARLRTAGMPHRPYAKFAKNVMLVEGVKVQQITAMERVGLLVDKQYVAGLSHPNSAFQREIRKSEEAWNLLPEVIEANRRITLASNVGSGSLWEKDKTRMALDLGKPAHKQMLFFDVCGIEATSYGKNGLGSVDKAFKQTHREVPIIRAFADLEEGRTMYGTFVVGYNDIMAKSADMGDGRLRTYFDGKASTSRLKSRLPNLQNQPTRKERGKMIKRQFVAARGRLIRKRDFSAHEVRMLGITANDPQMAERFWVGMQTRLRYAYQREIPAERRDWWKLQLQGADVHYQNYGMMYGVDPTTVTKDQRAGIKTTLFAATYGKSMPVLGLELKLEETTKLEDRRTIALALANETPEAVLRKKVAEAVARLRKDGRGADWAREEMRAIDEEMAVIEKKDWTRHAEGLYAMIFDEKFVVAGRWLRETMRTGARTTHACNVLGGVRHLYGYLHPERGVRRACDRRGPNCVDDRTQCLTEHGWRRHDQLTVGDRIYTKNPASGDLELQPIEHLTVSHYRGKMFRANNHALSALTTPNHRWLATYRRKIRGKKTPCTGLVDSEWIARDCTGNAVHLVADRPIARAGDGTWSDDEVSLIGWVLTDGYFESRGRRMEKGRRIGITQSLRGNPHKVAAIDATIARLGIAAGRSGPSPRGGVRWRFAGELGARVRAALPDKLLNAEFLNALSTRQLTLLYDAMLLGNGSLTRGGRYAGRYASFGAGTRAKAYAFSHLCVLLGVPHRVVYGRPDPEREARKPWYASMPNVPIQREDFWSVKLKSRTRAKLKGNASWENYDGTVWCPTVRNGTFIARRNGTVYVTGNSSIQGPSSNLGLIAAYFTRETVWRWFVSRGVPVDNVQCNAVHDCVIGSTLVPTTRGLLRIDEMANARDGDRQNIDYAVGSRYGEERAARWIRKGIRPVHEYVTQLGPSVTGTDNHRMLALIDGRHDWIRLEDVRRGTVFCLSPRHTLRTAPLSLASVSDYVVPDWIPNGCTEPRPRTQKWIDQGVFNFAKPSHMTPDLAFVVALIISEGMLRDRGSIIVANMDVRLLEAYCDRFERVFARRPRIRLNVAATRRTGNRQYAAVLNSKPICHLMKELGLYAGGYREGKSPAYFKVVPWSIRHADAESQRAFMMGYLEGDGSTTNDAAIIRSASLELIQQMHALLTAHGYHAGLKRRERSHSVIMNADVARSFMHDCRPYRVSRTAEFRDTRRGYGVPAAHWNELMRARFVGNGWYTNDDGERVRPDILGYATSVTNWNKRKFIPYDEPNQFGFLEALRMVSASEHAALKECLRLRYTYTPVVNKFYRGEQEVFDLSIKNGEPAYIANGMICHNSLESETDIVNIPLMNYVEHHCFSTRIHHFMRDVMGHAFNVGLESDAEVGATFAVMHAAPRWDQEVEAIRASLAWGNEHLDWRLPVDPYMRAVRHNARIIHDLRRAEIAAQLRGLEQTTYDMRMTGANCLRMGLIFRVHAGERTAHRVVTPEARARAPERVVDWRAALSGNAGGAP